MNNIEEVYVVVLLAGDKFIGIEERAFLSYDLAAQWVDAIYNASYKIDGVENVLITKIPMS